MKHKHDGRMLLGTCIVTFLIAIAFYRLVDSFGNGLFADWFVERFMTAYLTVDGEYVWGFAWGGLRDLITMTLFWGMFFCVTIAVISAHIYAKIKVKETITEISEEVCIYMGKEENDVRIFPTEHAEISAQMAQIKATIGHHEQILKEEAARKNDLIAYLAHDLKTPLTSVIGYLSLLKEAEEMPPAMRTKYLGITLEKALRLERLINEFFDITRYNLQNIQLEKERIDLSYLLIQLTDEFYPLLTAHKNTVDLQMNSDLTVYGDPEKLARVFNNILKNAIAYSYSDTVIEIHARCLEGQVQILFRNKGKTIPEHKLHTIFEKFFRLDEARTTNTGGAGLGLAIAKEIITLHGGTIQAESRAEVTTFCVSIPEKAE